MKKKEKKEKTIDSKLGNGVYVSMKYEHKSFRRSETKSENNDNAFAFESLSMPLT